MGDSTPDDLDPDIADQFEKWYADRSAKDEAKRNRSKPPKDFGEALDRIADTVLDKLDERVEQRRRAAEDAEQEPDRGNGGKSPGWLRALGG